MESIVINSGGCCAAPPRPPALRAEVNSALRAARGHLTVAPSQTRNPGAGSSRIGRSGAGVDELLLPGEEGIAVGADLETQLLALRRPRGPSRPAGAMDVDDLVLGMDSWLHGAPRGGLCWPHKRLILPEKPSKFSPPHSTAAGRPRSKVRKCPSTSVHARRSTC